MSLRGRRGARQVMYPRRTTHVIVPSFVALPPSAMRESIRLYVLFLTSHATLRLGWCVVWSVLRIGLGSRMTDEHRPLLFDRHKSERVS